MGWRSAGAAVVSLLIADPAWAQSAPKPMSFNDAIVCHGVYTVVLEKAGAAGQTGATKADAYQLYAERAASTLGIKAGKSAPQIEAELAAGVRATHQMVGEGADDMGLTGIRRLYVYADVCFGILDRYKGMEK